MKRLRDVLPHEALTFFPDAPHEKHLDVEVTEEYHHGGWPGKQKHVFFWVCLANGKLVGWNENPSRGWSFPVINDPRPKST